MNYPQNPVLVTMFALVATAAAVADEIPFPEGYHYWTHIRSAEHGSNGGLQDG